MTFSPWLAGGALALLLAACAWAGVTQLQLQTARANVATLTAQMALAKSANDSNLETIKVQGKALDTWAGEAALGVAAADEATAQLKAANDARAASEAQLKARSAKDRALPGCVSLLALDLASICPENASAIKVRAQ